MAPSEYIRVGILKDTAKFSFNSATGEVMGGYEAPFFFALLKKMNLKPIFLTSKENEWGMPQPNGSWSGLIGMVQSGEADMAISNILITEDRMKVVDYSYPYYIEDVTFATKAPGTISTTMALVKPFKLEIWVILCLSLIILPVIFSWLFSKKYTAFKVSFILLGYLVNQPSGVVKGNLRERILVGAWICVSFILTKTYCLFLLSFLTLPIKQNEIKGIDQLDKVISEGIYKSYTPRGSVIIRSLSESNHPPTRRIAEAIIKNDWLLGTGDDMFVKYVNTENCAIIRTRLFIISAIHSPIFVSSESFLTTFSAIVLRKGSPFKIKLNHLINRINASGLYTKHVNDHIFRNRLKQHSNEFQEESGYEKLHISDIKGAFFFLLIGYACAFGTYIVEVVYNNLSRIC